MERHRLLVFYKSLTHRLLISVNGPAHSMSSTFDCSIWRTECQARAFAKALGQLQTGDPNQHEIWSFFVRLSLQTDRGIRAVHPTVMPHLMRCLFSAFRRTPNKGGRGIDEHAAWRRVVVPHIGCARLSHGWRGGSGSLDARWRMRGSRSAW